MNNRRIKEENKEMNKNYIELNNQILQKKDGFFQLEKDKEAIEAFLAEVEEKTMVFDSPLHKLYWLIQNNYYEDFFKLYTIETVSKLIDYVYSINFEFQSYMAVSKFYESYALKTDDKKHYLETYEDRIIAVALYLADGNKDLVFTYAEAMIKQWYQPATPTFLNAGKKRRGEMISCFLLEMNDSLNSINYNLATSMQLSKQGGGIATNYSKLRARGEAIKGIEGAASGVVPVMKIAEDSFNYANQLGQRKGSGAAYLNIFHWDIEEFLDTKKINADEKSRLQTLSIGLIIPDKFIELAKTNQPYYVFGPYSVYKEYGIHLDDMDMDIWYDQLVQNPVIRKRELNARRMLVTIARMQFESGYPYIYFKTTANKVHALPEEGQIKITNLCTEIMQVQETSVINDYGIEDEIKNDICCVLGSINVEHVMEQKSIEEAVNRATNMLTAVCHLSYIGNAPGVELAKANYNAIGLGALNFTGYLAKHQISYESPEAKDFANTFFMIMNYHSIKQSMKIAQKTNRRFKGFEKSTYATGEYFEKYVVTDYSPQLEKVKQLFEGIEIPTPKDWRRLRREVQKNGLYHAYRLAIAPTQSIGYIQNATPSISPIVDLIERRTYGNSTTYYPMPHLSYRTIFAYKSAYHMDMMKVIDLVSVIQQHIDQGISTVLYVDSNTSTKELVRYYLYAHKKGLKSLYYTRTKNLSIEDCASCAV